MSDLNGWSMGRPRAIGLMAAVLLLGAAGCEEKTSAKNGGGSGGAGSQPAKLSVASYDPTRELYREINPAFEAFFAKTTGRSVSVETDHGPSGKQARDVAAGKPSDVAALGVESDIDTIATTGALPANWRERLPNRAVPYYSAVVFLVRKGNPKNIKDWEDLACPEVNIVCPDPRTSGGARWSYLAIWGHAVRKAKAAGKSDAEAEDAARKLIGAIHDQAVMDNGARGSSTRFVQQQTGDVLFGWESEMLLIANDSASGGKYEVVRPSESILIEVPLAVVEKRATEHGVLDIAEAYAKFHFSDEAQEILARRYNRPSNAAIAQRHKDKFGSITLFKFRDLFSDWASVTKRHFAAGGEFERAIRK